MKAIIFGINGQDGFYLKGLLNKNHVQVIGVSRSAGDWIQGDVKNGVFVSELIKKQHPDFVFHLAANSTTQHYALFENHETISTGALNILEAVYRNSNKTKVFLAGSAMQFKNNGTPIDENTPFEANSPYAVSRIQSVYAGRYFRTLGLKVYVGYLFHHDSPRRREKHLNMSIVKAAIRIKNGADELIEIGNPSVIKEFNHASDIASAIWMLVNQEQTFEIVIGGGIGHTIKEWINTCFRILEIDDKNYIKIKDDFIPDFLSLVSFPQSLKNLGWAPEYSMESLAKEMISFTQK